VAITPEDLYWQAADAVLAALGDAPSAVALKFLVAWEWAEWGGTDGLARTNNPMATTLPEPGATDWNSAGVKVYPSLAVGAQATAATLLRSPDWYGAIVQGLRTGDPSVLFGPGGTYGLAVWAGGPGNPNYGYASRVQATYAQLPEPPSWALAGGGTGSSLLQRVAAPLGIGLLLLVSMAAVALGVAEETGWLPREIELLRRRLTA
jgi:hypothetical protein